MYTFFYSLCFHIVLKNHRALFSFFLEFDLVYQKIKSYNYILNNIVEYQRLSDAIRTLKPEELTFQGERDQGNVVNQIPSSARQKQAN